MDETLHKNDVLNKNIRGHFWTKQHYYIWLKQQRLVNVNLKDP